MTPALAVSDRSACTKEIPNPGDFFVRDIEVLGMSVIVARGPDGQLRAFHNVCPHRGNRIVRAADGCVKGWQCDFHGWTFATDGTLQFVPDEGHRWGAETT